MIPLYHPVQVSTLCTGIIWVLSDHHILWGRLLAKLSDCRFPSEIVACALIFPVAWVQLSSISAFVQNKYSWNSPKNSSSMEHTYFWWRWSTCIYMYPENDGYKSFWGGGGKVGKNTSRSLHAAWAFGKSYINSFLTLWNYIGIPLLHRNSLDVLILSHSSLRVRFRLISGAQRPSKMPKALANFILIRRANLTAATDKIS